MDMTWFLCWKLNIFDRKLIFLCDFKVFDNTFSLVTQLLKHDKSIRNDIHLRIYIYEYKSCRHGASVTFQWLKWNDIFLCIIKKLPICNIWPFGFSKIQIQKSYTEIYITKRMLQFNFLDDMIWSLCLSFDKCRNFLKNSHLPHTTWKVSKYGVISGPYFPVFGPEITPYLDTFHTVKSFHRGNYSGWKRALNKQALNL